MGQYYRACFINEKKNEVVNWFLCYDTNNFAKLMEHSYIGNRFVMNVTYNMIHSPKRLVWCGDYGDEVAGTEQTYYDMTDDNKKIAPTDNDVIETALKHNTYYINHDKKEWFDICKQVIPAEKGWGKNVHPLPILTANGNGRGGGDYHGVLMNMVGTWSGDLIEVSDTIPTDYKEIFPWFTEMSQDEVDKYMEELNAPKKKFTIRIDYTTSEEFVIEAKTEEEAIMLAKDKNPDETQVYENLTIDGSPRVLYWD
jgi:hypothetical protein